MTKTKKKSTLRDMTRQCLVQDDDGHWYCITPAEKSDFETWVQSSYENVGYEGPDFEDKRINGPHTFTFIDGREE
jgi:hypothetical protein